MWFEDPDGNAWEVFVVKGDTEVMMPGSMKGGCSVPRIGSEAKKAGGGCCG